jgi:hypothetical protein
MAAPRTRPGGLPPTDRSRVHPLPADAQLGRADLEEHGLARGDVDLGLAGGLAVITAAGLAATYLSMPLWYWATSHPHQEYGVTNLGFLTVDTLGEAGIAAAIGLLLVPFVLLLARWCAATYAGLAVRMLGSGSGTP